MARTLQESPITTPNARKSLPPRIHWRSIDRDIHLGYRPHPHKGGAWLVRWYKGQQQYQQETIGTADDELRGDNLYVFSWSQAAARAKKIVTDRRAEARAAAQGTPLTVESAVKFYLQKMGREDAERGGTGDRRDIRARFNKHVLNKPLKDIPLYKLTQTDLSEWKASLLDVMSRTGATRMVTNLKAALNHTAREKRDRVPPDFLNTIKFGLAAEDAAAPEARHDQAYPEAVIRHLVNVSAEIDREDQWEGDLHRMVMVLAATGARFIQIARMRVGDVQPEHRRLMVPTSRKGRGTKASSHTAVKVEQSVINALLPVMQGRAPDEILLERWYSKQVSNEGGRPVWVREKRDRWHGSSSLRPPWKKIVARAQVKGNCIPYSLRHSSIVRMLSNGTPIRYVAALHDTSSAMIEKHYSAAIVEFMEDRSDSTALSFEDVPGNVLRLDMGSESRKQA